MSGCTMIGSAGLSGAFGPDSERARKLYDAKGDGHGFIIATNASADAAMIEPARAIARVRASRLSGAE